MNTTVTENLSHIAETKPHLAFLYEQWRQTTSTGKYSKATKYSDCLAGICPKHSPCMMAQKCRCRFWSSCALMMFIRLTD